jgi:hypothetical protein
MLCGRKLGRFAGGTDPAEREPADEILSEDFKGPRKLFDIKARYPSGKGEVCKTFMRRFDSDPRLQILRTIVTTEFDLSDRQESRISA